MKLCIIVAVFLIIMCRATAASCEEDERMGFRKVLDRFGNKPSRSSNFFLSTRGSTQTVFLPDRVSRY